MMQVISLEEAWSLLEILNDNANQKTRDFWNSVNEQEAIRQQSECFRNNFLNLDNSKQQAIRYWIYKDDEFQDYFKCLSGKDFITSL
jgi:hypothetical protein